MTVPTGRLPVFSVATEDDAKALIVVACPYDRISKHYYAPELAQEQSLDNLAAFSSRLAELWFKRMGREPERYQAQIKARAERLSRKPLKPRTPKSRKRKA